jgi:hypothetical protein
MPLKGRPPKPSRVLEMNGSFQHNPSRKRARANEPQTGKCFDSAPPPEFLIPEPELGYQFAARCLRQWQELALEGPYIGYGSRGTVISLCILKANMLRIASGSKELSRLMNTEDKLRSSLGLTEVSRPKVNAGSNPNSARGSALAGLAQEIRGRDRA